MTLYGNPHHLQYQKFKPKIVHGVPSGTNTNGIFYMNGDDYDTFKNVYHGYSTVDTPNINSDLLPSIIMDVGSDALMDKAMSNFQNANTPLNNGVSNPGKFFDTKGLKGLYTKLMNPNFSWNKGSGIQGWGHNIGKFGNIAGGAIHGIRALGKLNELGESNNDAQDLVNQIITSYNSNPMAGTALTSSQKSLINKLTRDGKTDPHLGDFINMGADDIGMTALGALGGFAVGGVPGAIINGVGTFVNRGLDNMSEAGSASNAELEALLFALQDSEMQYQNMLRANAQRRFQNLYI